MVEPGDLVRLHVSTWHVFSEKGVVGALGGGALEVQRPLETAAMVIFSDGTKAFLLFPFGPWWTWETAVDKW